jgi:putative heme-binding domain-containing protein
MLRLAAGMGAVLLLLAPPGIAEPAKGAQGKLVPLVQLLAESNDVAVQRDVLRGMHEALQGRQVAPPEGWSAVYRKLADSPDAEVREKVLRLSVLFGDPAALAALRRTAADAGAPAGRRQAALQTLIEKRPPDLLPLLRDLLADRAMRAAALRGLAAYDDPGTPELILRHYASCTDAEKAAAVATLAARPGYALALLDAMEKGRVPRRDLSPFVARQLLGFNDRRVAERLNAVWGSIRPAAKDRTALMEKYKALATPQQFKKADRAHGRMVFSRNCANCHTLFDDGGKIGPDLTGSQRANPEYVLTKVLDPNAVVARDYQVTAVVTADGRAFNGIVKEETDKTLTLQTPTEVVRLAKADVEERKRMEVSMMPEGLLAPMSETEVRDLLAYLAGAGQVPLPKPSANRSP